MPTIHPLAVVDSSAELADDVIVGPFCYVQGNARLGAGCVLESHATVRGNTVLGERNVIGQGAVIGGDPQDRKWKGEPVFLEIGNDNVIREYVTIHRATGEGNYTKVGNRCYIMAYSHFGHNCMIEDDVTITSYVGISGHVTIEPFVTIGGMAAVHQYCRIGKAAMVGGMTRVVMDIPPFMISEGSRQEVHDINAVGLRRIGITSESRMCLHKACKLLFKSQLGLNHAMDLVRREVKVTDEVEYLLQFMARRGKGKNGRGDQP